MIDNFLARSRSVFKSPKIILIAGGILTLFFMYGLTKFVIDTDIQNMMPEKSKVRLDYFKYEKIFGSSGFFFIGVESDDAFSRNSLNYVKAIVDKLKTLNSTLPPQNVSALLGISTEEAVQVINLINEQGLINENDLKSLLSDRERLSNEFFMDQNLAEKIAKKIKKIKMSALMAAYDVPIKNIQSLVNSDYIKGEKNNISIESLIDENHIDEASIAGLKKKINSWDFYRGVLISYDNTLTSILVQLNVTEVTVRKAVYKSIKEIVDTTPKNGLKTFISGEPVLADSISEFILNDAFLLIPLVLVVVTFVLLLAFRLWEGVVYPLMCVILSSIWALGTMSYCGIPINMISTCMPVLLVAMGSAYGLHFMNSYFLHKSTDKLEIVNDNIVDVGISIAMSALATIVGFGSLATNEFVHIRHFAIFTAIGIFYAFVISLYIVPSMMIVSKKKKTHFFITEEHEKGDLLYKVLFLIDKYTKKRSGIIIICSFIIMAFCFLGIIKIKAEMNAVTFFKDKTDIRQADTVLNKKLAGTQTLTIILESKDGQSIINPEILNTVDNYCRTAREQYPIIRKVISINEFLKKMNQEMKGGAPEYYVLPDNEAAFNNSILLLSGKLDNVLTAQKDKMRILFSIKRTTTSEVKKIVDYTNQYFNKEFLDKNNLSLNMTGVGYLEVVVNKMITEGQLHSIVLSAIIVFFINLLVFRNLFITLISLIPMFLGLAINFGLMGFLNIPLNAGTSMVSAVAIGVGIDYAIHFIIRYRTAYRKKPDIDYAIHDALTIRGRGIVYNIIAVMAGFLVLLFSQFNPIIQFGYFIAINMITTGFGALILVPAAIRLFSKQVKNFK